MTDPTGDAVIGGVQWGPWTACGGPDGDFDEVARQVHHALLTDPNLLRCFRRRFPEHGDADYDEMVRLLGYVWDCPGDGTANVTGFRCGRCGRTRAQAVSCGTADRVSPPAASQGNRPRPARASDRAGATAYSRSLPRPADRRRQTT